MRNHHYGLKRLACCLLAGVLVAVTAVPVAMADYKQKWEQAEQQLKEEKNKYNQIKDQKAKEEKKKKSLQNQQYIIKSQIKDTMGQINHKIEEIATQEQAIADQQQKIDERWAGFQDRMLAMQIMHDSGAVAMIASAKSMYDLLNFSKALQQISQKDTEVLADMNQQKQLLEEEKAKLESAKNDLESAKQSLDSKQSQLAENIRQQDQNISEQDALAQAQSEVVAQAQKNADEAERQYDAWIKQNASSGSGALVLKNQIFNLLYVSSPYAIRKLIGGKRTSSPQCEHLINAAPCCPRSSISTRCWQYGHILAIFISEPNCC